MHRLNKPLHYGLYRVLMCPSSHMAVLQIAGEGPHQVHELLLVACANLPLRTGPQLLGLMHVALDGVQLVLILPSAQDLRVGGEPLQALLE